VGPVRTAARHDDPHGGFLLVESQALKKMVYGQPVPPRMGGLLEPQTTLAYRNVMGWRKDIDGVRLYADAVIYLYHLHAGLPRNELHQNALVIGRKMLYQNEGEAMVFTGIVRKKSFESG